MSTASFKRTFTNPLLKRLNAEMRASVERQKGQLLVLGDLKAFEEVLRDEGIEIPNSDSILKEGQAVARKLQEEFRRRFPQRYGDIVAKIPEILGLKGTIGEDLFIVQSFRSSIDRVKRAILNALERDGVLDADTKTRIATNIHKGHGVSGMAVSEVDIASTLADINRRRKLPLLREQLDAYFARVPTEDIIGRKIEELFTTYSSVVDLRGNLRTNYVSVVTFQVGAENIGIDSAREKKVKAIFRNFISQLTPELLQMRGSSSLIEKIEHVIVKEVSPKPTKRIKVQKSPAGKSAQTRTKGSVKVKNTEPKLAKRAPQKTGSLKKRAVEGAVMSVSSIKDLIDRNLNKQVASRMRVPRLQYRTGTFASSVRTTTITQRDKSTTIGYTYQRSPYQVFEMGIGRSPWRTIERDPRILIEQSIRAIVAGKLEGRLYFRRT